MTSTANRNVVGSGNEEPASPAGSPTVTQPLSAAAVAAPVAPSPCPHVRPPLREGDFKISEFRFYVVCAMLVSEAIASSMLYSYVGLFVAHIEPTFTRSSAGYVAGFLVGAFQATQVFALPLWGRLSDRIGRRPVLLAASWLSVGASVLFGFAPSFLMAMLARAVHGLVGGGVAIGKTLIYEVTDQHSQARGLGLMNLMWALGSFVGPSIGGFLYDINNSPIFSKVLPHIELFDEHPALPPALAMAMYAALAGILAFLFVPETNPNRVPFSHVLRELRQWFLRLVGLRKRRVVIVEPTEEMGSGGSVVIYSSAVDSAAAAVHCEEDARHPEAAHDEDIPDRTPMLTPMLTGLRGAEELLSNLNLDDELRRSFESEAAVHAALALAAEKKAGAADADGDDTTAVDVPEKSAVEAAKEAVPEVDTQPDDGYLEVHREVDAANERLNAQKTISATDIFTHPLLRIAIPLYMILCSYNIAYNEVFPLYAVAFREDGGLGFSSTQVGIAGMVNAVVSVCANSVFARVSKRWPMMTIWIKCNTLSIFAFLSIGLFTYLPSPTWCLIVFLPLCLVRTTTNTWAFALTGMFTANAAPKKHLGVVTTTTMAGASVARSLTPMIAAPIFAWSISGDHIFPFNHFMLFVICALLSAACVVLAWKLPQEVIGIRRK